MSFSMPPFSLSKASPNNKNLGLKICKRAYTLLFCFAVICQVAQLISAEKLDISVPVTPNRHHHFYSHNVVPEQDNGHAAATTDRRSSLRDSTREQSSLRLARRHKRYASALSDLDEWDEMEGRDKKAFMKIQPIQTRMMHEYGRGMLGARDVYGSQNKFPGAAAGSEFREDKRAFMKIRPIKSYYYQPHVGGAPWPLAKRAFLKIVAPGMAKRAFLKVSPLLSSKRRSPSFYDYDDLEELYGQDSMPISDKGKRTFLRMFPITQDLKRDIIREVSGPGSSDENDPSASSSYSYLNSKRAFLRMIPSNAKRRHPMLSWDSDGFNYGGNARDESFRNKKAFLRLSPMHQRSLLYSPSSWDASEYKREMDKKSRYPTFRALAYSVIGNRERGEDGYGNNLVVDADDEDGDSRGRTSSKERRSTRKKRFFLKLHPINPVIATHP